MGTYAEMFALGPNIKTFTSDDVLNPFWNEASYI